MILDCKGKPCPQPVVLAMKALETLPEGENLTVIVDNEAALGNVTRMAEGKAYTVSAETNAEGISVLTIGKGDAEAVSAAAVDEKPVITCTGASVIVIGSDEMGQGDEKLGKMLMKAYLYALAQMPDEKIPQTILFFNGGARLTTEESASLTDIRSLQKRGVEILTCGTCLDFYGIKEKLAVGSVTNMYTIAEKQLDALKVIRI